MRRLVLGIAVAVTSLMPVVGMADDQQIAEYVKSRLKSEQEAGNLKGFNVDMRVDGGTVWFEGFVSTPQQQMTILRTAQQAGHLGVVQVVDDIEVRQASPYQAAAPYRAASATYQGEAQAPVQSASYGAPVAVAPVAPAAPAQEYVESYNEPLPFAACESCAGGTPVADGGYYGGEVVGGSYGGGAPMPAGYGGQPGASGPANLPGYAWPSYAAAPNYGAVSYPRQHSASAWPYIGPFYPYPQVPLGWRKVTLEWDDGWWNLDFHDK